MAARLVLKRANIFELFPQRFASRTFCIAAANTENNADNVQQDISHQTKENKKDFAKIAAYEEYRTGVESVSDSFKKEYKKKKAREKRRLEEINQGSFSPYEQHKKAVQDIIKYNESKESIRMNKDTEKRKRLQEYYEKQREDARTKQLEQNRELVLKVIEESKSFVTMENLEEKIQEVLSKETNYNFAITSDGKKIFSKEQPNNLGMQGPGPLAYRTAGQRFPYKERSKEDWRPQRRLTKDSKLRESDSIDESSDSSDSSDDEDNK